jgi:hypothetical protein
MLVIFILLQATRMVFRFFEPPFVHVDLISQLANSVEGRGKASPAIDHSVSEKISIHDD